MTFTTVEFAILVAVTFIIYYLVPDKFRWMVLLAAGGYFYYQTGIGSFVFLLVTIAVSYVCALLIERTGSKWYLMLITVVLFVGMLCVMRMPFAGFIMPMGLSFYALGCLGYCIEVYRKSTPAQKNPAKYALYISFFPHVLQGPFEDYNEMKAEFEKPHPFDYDMAVYGMYRIVFGVLKKLVIADRISYIVDKIYASPDSYYGMTLVLCMFLYSLQLYADFSGYMDIAVGCAKLFGINIRENFNVPYASKSMAEFWRRWHMSLGLWFKSYVFYPVQRTRLCTGIRKYMKARKNRYGMTVIPSVIGLVCVWTLIGLWHGFDWNYLVYDWTCGLIIIISELLRNVYDRLGNALGKVYKSRLADMLRVVRTFILVSFTFVLFRPDTLGDSFTFLRRMFMRPGMKDMAEFVYWNIYDLFLILVPVIVLVIVDTMKYKGINVCEKLHRLNPVVRYIIYGVGLVYIYVAQGDREQVAFAYSIF